MPGISINGVEVGGNTGGRGEEALRTDCSELQRMNRAHTTKKILWTLTRKKKYINFGARRILRPLPCTEFNSIQGNGDEMGVAA